MKYGRLILMLSILLTLISNKSLCDGDIYIVTATQPYVKGIAPYLKAKIPTVSVPVIYRIVPPKLKSKASAMGFDVNEIYKKVLNLNQGASFSQLSEGTNLEIEKDSLLGSGQAQTLILKLGSRVGMKFDMKTINKIIRFLTFSLSELRGHEDDVQQLIEILRNLPPGIYLEGFDGQRNYELILQ